MAPAIRFRPELVSTDQSPQFCGGEKSRGDFSLAWNTIGGESEVPWLPAPGNQGETGGPQNEGISSEHVENKGKFSLQFPGT